MRVAITGASRGIGARLMAAYSSRGAEVMGTSRRGGNGLVALDLAESPDFAPLVASVGDGPLDLLVCNAGIYPDKGQSLDTGFDGATWARSMAVNVAGPFLTVQALLPALRRTAASSGGAKIAIISSAMGSQARAPGGAYIYRASKAAALNVARNLSRDLARDGIAVGAYHPGWVRTEMGGAGAEIDADQSAEGLVARFEELTAATTGCFRNWDGADVPF